jgi:hypothetical protein
MKEFAKGYECTMTMLKKRPFGALWDVAVQLQPQPLFWTTL